MINKFHLLGKTKLLLAPKDITISLINSKTVHIYENKKKRLRTIINHITILVTFDFLVFRDLLGGASH